MVLVLAFDYVTLVNNKKTRMVPCLFNRNPWYGSTLTCKTTYPLPFLFHFIYSVDIESIFLTWCRQKLFLPSNFSAKICVCSQDPTFLAACLARPKFHEFMIQNTCYERDVLGTVELSRKWVISTVWSVGRGNSLNGRSDRLNTDTMPTLRQPYYSTETENER